MSCNTFKDTSASKTQFSESTTTPAAPESKSSLYDGLAAMAAALGNEPSIAPTVGLNEKGMAGAAEHKYDFLTELEDLFVAYNNSANHGDGFEKSLETVLAALVSGMEANPKLHLVASELMLRMMAHIRDCRKEGMGKGSRDPTMFTWMYLFENHPKMRPQLEVFMDNWLLKYGCVRDARQMWLNVCSVGGKWYGKFPETRGTTESLVVGWFVNMHQHLMTTENSEHILAAKWFPSESKRKGKDGKKQIAPVSVLARKIAKVVFSDTENCFKAYKLYRKSISKLRAKLKLVETAMCARKHGEIEHAHVPGRASSKYRKAFEFVNMDDAAKRELSRSNPSYYASRQECAAKRGEFLGAVSRGEKSAKGTSLFITELAARLSDRPSSSDQTLYEGMFRDQVQNLEECALKNGIDMGEFLGQFVCLLDFSGSMQGTPMDLCRGLACLLTPLAKGPFKGKFISFETKPSFVDLMVDGPTTTPTRMLEVANRSPWGGNTNFEAAQQLILDKIVETVKRMGLSYEQACSMLPRFFLVVSDMQFDAAAGDNWNASTYKRWTPMHNILKSMYRMCGEKLFGSGKGFKLPTMIYWNARSDTGGMPVVAQTPGAMMVSGYSSGIVKTLLTAGADALAAFTPWAHLKSTLMNEWYDQAVAGPLV